jgi:hypothetical protein
VSATVTPFTVGKRQQAQPTCSAKPTLRHIQLARKLAALEAHEPGIVSAIEIVIDGNLRRHDS